MARPLQALCLLGALAAHASAEPVLAPQDHARLGVAAATVFPGFADLCDLDQRMRDVNVAREGEARRARAGTGERPPAEAVAQQVFDNLYVFGTPSVTAWLYGTEAGYILIDGLNTDAEAEAHILGGMAALGLDPRAIRHVLVTHGHGDHYGGADLVAQTVGAPVTMSAPDWELVARLGDHPRHGPPPERGETVADGDVLIAGETRLTVYLTPGHTPGTLSPVFEVYDRGAPHLAMIWGGTGFNFGPRVPIFEQYARSAERMAGIAAERGIDVILSGHPARDGTMARLAALEARAPGAPHPFVSGPPGHSIFAVLEHCALAQAGRFAGRDQEEREAR